MPRRSWRARGGVEGRGAGLRGLMVGRRRRDRWGAGAGAGGCGPRTLPGGSSRGEGEGDDDARGPLRGREGG